MRRRVLNGISASGGVAVGPARIKRDARYIVKRRIVAADVPAEVNRLRDAARTTGADLIALEKSLVAQERSELGDQGLGLVFRAHALLLEDELLVGAAALRIERDLLSAAAALDLTAKDLAERLGQSGSSYLSDRAHDVEQVAKHVIDKLASVHEEPLTEVEGAIIVAHDPSPADVLRLARSQIIGLVTEQGSASGHAALVARTFGLATVVGVRGITDLVDDGDEVIVDGFGGIIVLDADSDECEAATARGKRYDEFTSELKTRGDAPNLTADGERVWVHANLELPEEAVIAVESGGEGVGLYRTEFLYLESAHPPTEEEQYQAFAEVIRAFAPRPVTIRTYDLGIDKLPADLRREMIALRGPNPALGMRAVRLSLLRRDLLITQLRAILRAAALGEVRLLIPLVSRMTELRQVKEAVSEVAAALDAEGVARGEVEIGVMIEVPSAAILVDKIAKQCAFLSVGTNDLVQYTLAIDRQNPLVAHEAGAFEPAVLRLLARVVEEGSRAGIDVVMCGDMAADPVAAPLVIGLGYRVLSVPCGMLPIVRALVARVDVAHARAVAREVLELETGEEVLARVREAFGETLGDLWGYALGS
jgi:phosphoenolpyruvate-protein phosphotransferase (PTS system enzyme I)